MAALSSAQDERLQTKTQQLNSLIQVLADRYLQAAPETEGYPLRADIERHNEWLTQAYQFFRETSRTELNLTYASEWLLDNFYIISQALDQIEEDLSAGFYHRLPKLTHGSLNGFPRIYAITRHILTTQYFLLNTSDLQLILTGLQDKLVLSMGELWAVPIFLRYAVLEALSFALLDIIDPDDQPDLPLKGRVLTVPLVNEQPDSSALVANAVLSLRAIADQSWLDFFENTSRVEQILRADPAGLYPHMDFQTRDVYRKQIEQLATASGLDETRVIEMSMQLVQQAKDQPASEGADSRQSLLGYYLIDAGRPQLEEYLGARFGFSARWRSWLTHHPTDVYFGGIALIAAVLAISTYLALDPVRFFSASPASALVVSLLWLVLIIPILTIATHVMNWLVTLLLPPRILPKLSFRDEIPPEYHTLVVIPALISSNEEVDDLARQLLVHYLRNSESGLSFALLTDYTDADSENLPEDAALLEHARAAIERLNRAYPTSDGIPRFYLFHRHRVFNPGEGRWIAWERKRGKLHELNALLLGKVDAPQGTTFIAPEGDLDVPQKVRYVITLDADTILPGGAARRLVGTLAHPLNQARFDPSTGQVVSGYTILQPRVEISPTSANRSWFTRIFSGDTGLDLYSRAVSDTYQDLFGEGIYVGKGIYDVAAFDRSVDDRIPENTILSHDLLEGLFGRAALVSDITLIEDYPPSYFISVMRQQRWVRGDWQLLPWLVNPRRFNTQFSGFARWKIVDNLRRSLLAPALLVMFIAGNLWQPALSWLWTVILLLATGIPVLTGLAQSIHATAIGNRAGSVLRPLGWALLRAALAVAFLPYEAYHSLEAILITIYRLLISRKNLLQWTTAARTVQLFRGSLTAAAHWQRMALVAILALVVSFSLAFLAPEHLPSAMPVLLLWLLAPPLSSWISSSMAVRTDVALDDDDRILLRQIARRTWAFFERFVGPEDHWLPPDHFQEYPVGMVAHRTSPTNIGLLLNSTLAAYDFGYLDPLSVATRLSATFDSLASLERFRGHFLNWYDTVTMQPLNPRYVSTVDSGNLAASLIVTAQACRSLPQQPIFRWELWQGYLDTLSILADTLAGVRSTTNTRPLGMVRQEQEIEDDIQALRVRILSVKEHPRQWYDLFQEITGSMGLQFFKRLSEMVMAGPALFDLETLRVLQQVSGQLERQHLAVQRILDELVPWIALFQKPPAGFFHPENAAAFANLREALPYRPSITFLHQHLPAARLALAQLRALTPPDATEAQSWLDAIESGIDRSHTAVSVLLNGYQHLADRAEQFLSEMNFEFLYHPQRRIFHIGYNLDSGQLDNNYYDLLASEARIASLISIAKGEIPPNHWLYLSRPVTESGGRRVLLSWSATMFEYLMPPLFFRAYPGTLLTESARGAVAHQIAYAQSIDLPWGISESGFYQFDAGQSYQYRAFGVPGLGFKRGLADDRVIAPYASLMAIGLDAQAVLQNIHALQQVDMLSQYGFYEAIDFTTERLPLGEKTMRVREFMSHHQGMILLALDNYLYADVMVKRMHSHPRIQSIELLLQEQVPLDAPLRNPFGEDVKGVQRTVQSPVEVSPWNVPVLTPIPQAHLLSNGAYSIIITNSGSGYSTWNGVDLTRWRPDGVLDAWGSWVYIQNRDAEQSIWSAGLQPVPGEPSNNQATFFPHMAVLRRSENGIISSLEITVPPDDPLEIRRIHLNNTNRVAQTIRLTSYGEVILNRQAADARHPAFNKLFIESEYVPAHQLQIYKRRPRSQDEAPIYLGHMLVISGEASKPVEHESDRRAFIGRYRSINNPTALESDHQLSGAISATLDPIFSLGCELVIPAHQSANLAFITIAADTREEVIALAERYSEWMVVNRAFQQADIVSQSWLSQQNMDTLALQDSLKILSALLYPHKAARASDAILLQNRLGQSGLWRFGISGDHPIILIEIENADHLDLAREVLQAHQLLRSRGFLVDVVILNNQQTNYGAELIGMLYRLVHRINSEQWLSQRGGIYILYRDQLPTEELVLLQSAARVVVSGARGSLTEQLPPYIIPVPHLPDFQPTRLAATIPSTGEIEELPTKIPEDVRLFNEYGGFSTDGREYIIQVSPGRPTPAPWSNVIGYPQFGFLVTESGAQTTWALNSGENRLTPWSNDPVSDPTGEAIYLRDEETGQFWSPTPLPSGKDQYYTVRHGAGYTRFDHESHQLSQELTLYASPTDPVKIVRLRVVNTADYPRRITVTQYVEWVLGISHTDSQLYILPEYDPDRSVLLASNPYQDEFRDRVAFLSTNKPVHGLTTDRVEFIGRGSSLERPAAMQRLGLETRIAIGEDPCGVLQVHLDLAPGGSDEVCFFIGQGENRAHTLELVDRYHQENAVEIAWEDTQRLWDDLLGTIQVQTPDPATDAILNRWLLYQAVSCRLWGRSGFYQSSGAYGFRDQLQDSLAMCAIRPQITREQILLAAAHQFDAGDVLHWWHPPSGRGVRTRFSDDLLWLPYVTAIYIETSGDTAILNEKMPFLLGEPLAPGEDERYGLYTPTIEQFTLLEHCLRAIEKGSTYGLHGLPLMGSGDWNDGMNRVGDEGRGESVWLGWFLFDVLNRFAGILEQLPTADIADQRTTATALRDRAGRYAANLEEHAWDGSWYRRAYDDEGTPLGSAGSQECRIDSIAQSWAVISGAGDQQRAREAMENVFHQLVLPDDRLILLFTPPFDKSPRDPGYIKGYLPGIRENGGQYTHAAVWAAWAFADLGNAERAAMLFDLLNPISQSRDARQAAQYRVEPYVVSADIYSVAPYLGRGGWTWYTGSASWLYRFGIERILGLRRMHTPQGAHLAIQPAVHLNWDAYSMRYRAGEAVYQIEVHRDGPGSSVKSIHLNGKPTVGFLIPLSEAAGEHKVSVVIG